MTATETITKPYDLKYAIEAAGTERHFFSRSTMQFFGDTMRNYGLRTATIETYDGPVECYELYRRRPVKHGLQSSAYFAKDTLQRRWPKA